MRRLRFHGLAADTYQRETQGRAPQAEVIEPGYKYNLPDMNAALGVSQLARLDEMNRKRTRLAERYRERLAARAGRAAALPYLRTTTCIRGISSSYGSMRPRRGSTATHS